MESIEEQVKEILSWFLYQDRVRRVESADKKITIYKIGKNVRVDIKID